MTLPEYLADLARELGPEALRGGVVLLRLDREIDRLIRLAHGLGPHHPGKESPWSHAILVADAWAGAGTPILDCTVRTTDGAVVWDEPMEELLRSGISRQGGIYGGTLADYDDPRVTAFGVKLVPDLARADRMRVVEQARRLQAAGFRYDIPVLVRELARLLTGIPVPAGDKRLFSSAFCQAAYRNALGARGDFTPDVRSEEATPDDLWYGSLGMRFLPPGAKVLR